MSVQEFDEALAFGRDELDKIAERFDVPIDEKSPEILAAIGLALHTRQVFRAVIRDCSTGDIPTAMLSLRALVEAAILIRWIEVSPLRHYEVWHAEGERQRLTAAKAWDEMCRRRGWQRRRPPLFTEQGAEEISRSVRRARANAVAHGEPLRIKGTECLPTIERMAHDTNDTAIWEAYEVVYRIASPWAHVSERVLVGYQLEPRADGTHAVPSVFWTDRSIRCVAVPAFAIFLGSASRICGLGVERECLVIQEGVAQWPSEALDGVKVATD